METTIKYSARDSIRLDVVERIAYLYGDAHIEYGNIKMDAGLVQLDWGNSVMKATGIRDSTGKITGVPIFEDEQGKYQYDTMAYNWKTKKGIVTGTITQQGEGYIHIEKSKRTEEEIYARNAHYTTCNLAHPHFFINCPKMVLIPDDKIVSGPFNVHISDIPTPLGFPLGIFPLPKKKKSGIMFPKFGNDAALGFNLQGGGYYFSINDYWHTALQGDIYSRGSWRAYNSHEYIKKYKYAGDLNLMYAKLFGDPFSEQRQVNENFWVRWNHRTLARRAGSFSANVNAGSSKFNKFTSGYNPNRFLQNEFSSGVNYTRTFRNTPFSAGTSLRQSQNTNTGIMTVTPEINFSMTRIYPFKRKVGGKKRWYEDIGVAYNMDGSLIATNRPRFAEDDTLNVNFTNISDLFKRDRTSMGISHRIPISTTFKVMRYFNLSPSVNYNEFWYPKRLQHAIDTNNVIVTADTLYGFNRTTSFNTGARLSTVIYGTFFNRNLRHTLIPALDYIYNPDFGTAPFNGYETFRIPGFTTDSRISKYSSFPYYNVPGQAANSIGFNLSNNLEAKFRNRDTAATETHKKVKLLDNLGIDGRYNFAADSFKLSEIRFNARANLFGRLDINFNTLYDPYRYRLISREGGIIRQHREDVYQWREDILHKKNRLYDLNVSLFLNPDVRRRKSLAPPKTPEELEMLTNPGMYVDFKIPWDVSLNYNFRYTKTGFQQRDLTTSISVIGNMKISEKWKVGISSGYDLRNKALTITKFDVYRDLHCWQMNFWVIPFGALKGFQFTISAKASILQSLKLNKARNWTENYF